MSSQLRFWIAAATDKGFHDGKVKEHFSAVREAVDKRG
jgi:hypothetical protein